MSEQPMAVIVDAEDKVIAFKHRGEIQYADIYRVAALWLSDAQTGEVLIAQRKWTKKNDPGKWSVAVEGTVEENETYESNIAKEAEEEIGLVGLEFTMGPKTYSDDGEHRFFHQWFLATVDKTNVEIRIQESEVEAVKWVSKGWLAEDVMRSPSNYVPLMPNDLRALGLLGTSNLQEIVATTTMTLKEFRAFQDQIYEMVAAEVRQENQAKERHIQNRLRTKNIDPDELLLWSVRLKEAGFGINIYELTSTFQGNDSPVGNDET